MTRKKDVDFVEGAGSRWVTEQWNEIPGVAGATQVWKDYYSVRIILLKKMYDASVFSCWKLDEKKNTLGK